MRDVKVLVRQMVNMARANGMLEFFSEDLTVFDAGFMEALDHDEWVWIASASSSDCVPVGLHSRSNSKIRAILNAREGSKLLMASVNTRTGSLKTISLPDVEMLASRKTWQWSQGKLLDAGGNLRGHLNLRFDYEARTHIHYAYYRYVVCDGATPAPDSVVHNLARQWAVDQSSYWVRLVEEEDVVAA